MTRADQREQTRARIVEAAVESFAELGFDASSTRDIAGRAGVTQGLLTYHFSSKEELWRAAADQIFDAIELPERPAASTETDDETAREAIRSYVRFAARHPELFAFAVDASRRDDERLRWLVETHLQTRYDAVAGLAARLYGDDDGPELAPHLFYGLTGAASLMFALSAECRALTGVDPTTDERIERHAELVARLLVPG
jgi:AcrR family transcriptional regulator